MAWKNTIVAVGALALLSVAAGNENASARDRYRHHIHGGVTVGRNGQPHGGASGLSRDGYYDPNVNNGSFIPQFAPNDPRRPFGGYSTITAPPGTDGYKEQQNNRRYYCEYAPEHC